MNLTAMLLSGDLPGLAPPERVHVPGAGDSTEVTFTLDAQLSGFKRLFMGTAVKKTMDAEAQASTAPRALWKLAPDWHEKLTVVCTNRVDPR